MRFDTFAPSEPTAIDAPETSDRTSAQMALANGDIAGARNCLLRDIRRDGETATNLRLLSEVEELAGNVLLAVDIAMRASWVDPSDIELKHRCLALLDGVRRPDEQRRVHRQLIAPSASPPLAIRGDEVEPDLERPVSQLVTSSQLRSPRFRQLIAALGVDPDTPLADLNRKQWEWAYIAAALESRGVLSPGSCGIGFGVGTEPLTSLFVDRGCSILATDLPADDVNAAAWGGTSQHAASIDALHHPEICDRASLNRQVEFQPVDMTDLSPLAARAGSFDFLWSSCVIEHLGGAALTERFLTQAVALLRPGGVAVHTTEYNPGSVVDPVEIPGITVFTAAWVAHMGDEFARAGATMAPFNPCSGTTAEDAMVDYPPYTFFHHNKLVIEYGSVLSTSAGLIVTRNG